MEGLPSFSLFGIPVTIRGSFLLIALLLGFSGVRDPLAITAWVLIVFVSILIHELGHALVARSFGARVEIELNGLGGLTRWAIPGTRELAPGRRALVAAAGSGVGVVFGGFVWLLSSQLGPLTGLTRFVVTNLIYVNLFWGLLNWLPIRPLDGGHLLQSLLAKVAPGRADMIARVVFTATAAIALVLSIRFERILIGFLSAWLLLSEFTMGRQTEERPSRVPFVEFGYDDDPDNPGLPAPPGDAPSPGLDDPGPEPDEPDG